MTVQMFRAIFSRIFPSRRRLGFPGCVGHMFGSGVCLNLPISGFYLFPGLVKTTTDILSGFLAKFRSKKSKNPPIFD